MVRQLVVVLIRSGQSWPGTNGILHAGGRCKRKTLVDMWPRSHTASVSERGWFPMFTSHRGALHGRQTKINILIESSYRKYETTQGPDPGANGGTYADNIDHGVESAAARWSIFLRSLW